MGRELWSPEAPVRRRTLTRGAVWAAPVVLVTAAAPAIAASPAALCAPDGTRYTLQWSSSLGTFTGTPLTPEPIWGGATVQGYSSWTYAPADLSAWGFSVTASSSYSGGSVPTNTSLAMRGTAGGYTTGVNLGWYAGTDFSGAGTSTSAVGGCFTFTFSNSLCNLTLALTDIDWGAREYVYVSSTDGVFTALIQDPTAVAGTGTALDPWHSILPVTELDNATSTRGNVVLHFATPVSTITFCVDSRAATATSFQENIALSNLTFDCPTTSSCFA